MNVIKWLAGILLIGYVGVAVLVYAQQEQLIFHPRVLPADYAYDWGVERLIQVDEHLALSTVWVDNPGEEVVLFLHGNVGDNNRARYQAKELIASATYDVVTVDYRGFGKSGGQPVSDAQLLADVQVVYQELAKTYEEDQIHLVGYSLGSGMAAYLAAHNQPASLTLVAPYTSLVDMKNLAFWWLPDFLLKYRLDTRSRMADISCPTRIYHGIDDQLIPFDMAETLAQLSPKHVTLYPLHGTGHRGAVLALTPSWIGAQ